jgi:hypothetical protein
MSGHVRRGFAAFLVAAGFAAPAAANPFTDLFSFNAAPEAAAAAPAPAAASAPAAPTAAPAPDDCLRQPGKTTAAGQHWVYRYDGHRRCWFQTDAGAARVRKAVRHHAARRPVAAPEESEAAPRKQRAVEDARDEMLSSATAEAPQPTMPLQTPQIQSPQVQTPQIRAPQATPPTQASPAAPPESPIELVKVVPVRIAGAAAEVPPPPVLAKPGADPLPPDQPAPRHVDVERLLAEAPAASDKVASAPPAMPVAVAPVQTDGGAGGSATWLGVLLIALGIAALSSSSLTLRRALWPVRSPQARPEFPAIADDRHDRLVFGWSGLAPAIDAARAGAARDELLHQRQKERLAEPAKRRFRLEIE